MKTYYDEKSMNFITEFGHQAKIRFVNCMGFINTPVTRNLPIGDNVYLCGYICIPEESTLNLIEPDKMEDCIIFQNTAHKGINFARKIKKEIPLNGDFSVGYWIGFDCCHSGDTLEKCNETYVRDCLNRMSRTIWEYDQVEKFKNNATPFLPDKLNPSIDHIFIKLWNKICNVINNKGA